MRQVVIENPMRAGDPPRAAAAKPLCQHRAHDAADRIYQASVRGKPGEKLLLPNLQPYDTLGSTRYVDFDTTRNTYAKAPDRCPEWNAKTAIRLHLDAAADAEV